MIFFLSSFVLAQDINTIGFHSFSAEVNSSLKVQVPQGYHSFIGFSQNMNGLINISFNDSPTSSSKVLNSEKLYGLSIVSHDYELRFNNSKNISSYIWIIPTSMCSDRSVFAHAPHDIEIDVYLPSRSDYSCLFPHPYDRDRNANYGYTDGKGQSSLYYEGSINGTTPIKQCGPGSKCGHQILSNFFVIHHNGVKPYEFSCYSRNTDPSQYECASGNFLYINSSHQWDPTTEVKGFWCKEGTFNKYYRLSMIIALSVIIILITLCTCCIKKRCCKKPEDHSINLV